MIGAIAINATGAVVEETELALALDCTSRGRVSVTLSSPSGTAVTVPRQTDNAHPCGGAAETWRLAFAGFLGERADGQWTVTVRAAPTAQHVELLARALTVYGHVPAS